MVGKRRALLEYLKKNDVEGYRELIARLGIRKQFMVWAEFSAHFYRAKDGWQDVRGH